MKLIDTHCHLNDEQLYQNLDEVIAHAQQVGVEKMIVIGWDKASSELAIKIAEQYPFIYACVGFHPENLEGVDEKQFLPNLPPIKKLSPSVKSVWIITGKKILKNAKSKNNSLLNKLNMRIKLDCQFQSILEKRFKTQLKY